MSAAMNGQPLALTLPAAEVERIAERAAELLAERQRPAESKLLTPAEVAEHLRCKPQRVYDLVSQRRLPCVKDGARVLVRRADLAAYLEGQA
jgi:excisionase family DNA binding protein